MKKLAAVAPPRGRGRRLRRGLGREYRAGLVPACPVPAALRDDRPRPCEELDLPPGAARGRDLHREQVRRRRALRRGGGRAHAAAAGHGAGDRGPDRRRRDSSSPTSSTRSSTSATAPGTSGTSSTATRTSAPRSPRTTRGRATSTSGAGKVCGIQFPETRALRREGARRAGVYADVYADSSAGAEAAGAPPTPGGPPACAPQVVQQLHARVGEQHRREVHHAGGEHARPAAVS